MVLKPLLNLTPYRSFYITLKIIFKYLIYRGSLDQIFEVC